MSDTTFVDGVTPVPASWLNDVNNLTYYSVSKVYSNLTGGKKLQEIRSAQDYGATGTSTIVDIAAINAGVLDIHNLGGGILKLNSFISTAIDLTSLVNYSDVVLQDERYKTAGHIAWFNTGSDTEIRVHGASTTAGEGPSFVMQNNATTGDRTGSLVARYGPMSSTKVTAYIHFGVWDGTDWTPDIDFILNGSFGGIDNFRSRLRVGSKGALIINPSGTGKSISTDTAYTNGYSLVVNRPAQDGGGYQFGIKNGAVEIPQELQITATNATVRFQNVSGANRFALISDFPSSGQFQLYDHVAGTALMTFTSGGTTALNTLGMTFIAAASASVPNNCLFRDSADNKLKFKDNGGVVNLLY